MSRGIGLEEVRGLFIDEHRISGDLREALGMAGFLSLQELKAIPKALPRATLIAGGAAGDRTVTGIEVGDRLVAVLHIDGTDASEAYNNLTSEFSITGDDTINNAGGTDTSGGGLVVVWEDLTP